MFGYGSTVRAMEAVGLVWLRKKTRTRELGRGSSIFLKYQEYLFLKYNLKTGLSFWSNLALQIKGLLAGYSKCHAKLSLLANFYRQWSTPTNELRILNLSVTYIQFFSYTNAHHKPKYTRRLSSISLRARWEFAALCIVLFQYAEWRDTQLKRQTILGKVSLPSQSNGLPGHRRWHMPCGLLPDPYLYKISDHTQSQHLLHLQPSALEPYC